MAPRSTLGLSCNEIIYGRTFSAPKRMERETFLTQETKVRGFLGGPVVKNSPSNAGDAGSIPGRGTKIPHATEQLSPCTTTTKPAL